MKLSRLILLLPLLAVTSFFYACKKKETQPKAPLLTNGNIEQRIQGWTFFNGATHPNNPNGYDYGFTTEAASSPQHSLKINCNQVQDTTAFSYYIQNLFLNKV